MNQNSKLWVGVISLLIVVGGVLWWLNSPPQKVSRQGYDIAMAVMRACNQQDEKQLAMVEAMIENSLSSGELPEQDARRLAKIIAKAKAGNWEAAARSIRQLMEDQIELVP